MYDVGILEDVREMFELYFQLMAWFIDFGRLLVNPGRTAGYLVSTMKVRFEAL